MTDPVSAVVVLPEASLASGSVPPDGVRVLLHLAARVDPAVPDRPVAERVRDIAATVGVCKDRVVDVLRELVNAELLERVASEQPRGGRFPTARYRVCQRQAGLVVVDRSIVERLLGQDAARAACVPAEANRTGLANMGRRTRPAAAHGSTDEAQLSLLDALGGSGS